MFTRYMLLAVEQRQKIDQRTIGDLFYLMVPELSDLPYYEALCHIMRQFADFVQQHALLDDGYLLWLAGRFYRAHRLFTMCEV